MYEQRFRVQGRVPQQLADRHEILPPFTNLLIASADLFKTCCINTALTPRRMLTSQIPERTVTGGGSEIPCGLASSAKLLEFVVRFYCLWGEKKRRRAQTALILDILD